MADDREKILEQFKEMTKDVDTQTHLDLGRAYRDMGLYPDAIAEFEKVLEADENNAMAHVLLIETKAMMHSSSPPSG